MSENKWIKGRELYKQGKVKIKEETDNKIYFIVTTNKDHEVIYDKTTGTLFCDCRYSAIHPSSFCSHKIAVYLYLLKEGVIVIK